MRQETRVSWAEERPEPNRTSHASRKGKIEESSEEQIIIHKLPSSLEFTDIVHHSVDDPEVTEVPSDPLDNAVISMEDKIDNVVIDMEQDEKELGN